MLRARYSKGEVQRFTTSISALGTDVVRSGALKVSDVRNGIATIRLTLEAPRDSKTHKPMGFPLKNLLKLDRMNRMQGSHAGSNLVVQFPARALPIGGTWVVDSALELGKNMGIALKMEYRLNSVQQRGRKRTAVLSCQMQGVATGSGEATIDGSDGSILSSSMNIAIKVSGQSYPVRLRVRRL